MSGVSNAVWLYGSHARGDADCLSDTDVLVVGQVGLPVPSLPDLGGRDCSISRYTWEEIELMAGYGSLFLHHLRLEGKELASSGQGGRRMREYLAATGPYQLVCRDLHGFWTCHNDVEKSLMAGGSPAFEASVLGGMVRHASVLGCYVSGDPDFGRISCIRSVAARLHLPESFADLMEDLYGYHLWLEGRTERPAREKDACIRQAVPQAANFLERLEARVNEYESEVLG